MAAGPPPDCMMRFRCAVMRTRHCSARVLPSIDRPAWMPRIRSCQASKPAVSSVPPTCWATYSFTRARLTTHSRSTAACTCWKSASGARTVSAVADGVGAGARQDLAHQIIVELVLDLDQRRGDVDQRRLGRLFLRGDQLASSLRDLGLHARALLTQAQHAQRVADLAQQFDLRRQLFGRRAAAAHEDVQHVLDLGQVLADRRGHRLHQLDGRRRQVLALLLDALVDRQQFVETERCAHRGDAAARVVPERAT